MRASSVDRGSDRGFSILVVLSIVFVILKLSPPVQEWSWWWVTAPLWIPIAIAAVIAFGKAMQS